MADILTSRLKVIEVYKGTLGPEVQMPSGDNGGDCSFKFENGGEFLVYARRDWGGLVTSHCTRSRRIEDTEDGELKWLRTGVTLPAPVAVQREVVECKRCALETIAQSLAGPNQGAKERSTIFGLEDDQAAQALASRRPFWTGGWYNYDDLSWTDMVGLSTDAKPFRLVLSPYYSTNESCRQSITLTYCSKLKRTKRSRGLAPFECVQPSIPTVVCDENLTRKASTLDIESMSAVAECDWRDAGVPRCRLDRIQHPLATGAAREPLFSCSPEFDSLQRDGDRQPGRYACRVRVR